MCMIQDVRIVACMYSANVKMCSVFMVYIHGVVYMYENLCCMVVNTLTMQVRVCLCM